MSEGFILPPRVIELHHEQLLIQADQVKQEDMQLATPSEEQIRSADGVFSQPQKTDDGAAALAGVTAGFLMLHDMTVERFTSHAFLEERPEPKDKPEKE